MIHTIFFDIGGTLVTGESTLKPLAEKLDPERKDEIFEFMKKKFFEMYLDENPPRFHTVKELLAICAQKASEKFGLPDICDMVPDCYRRAHLENDVLFEDTLPTLQRLKKGGIKLILASDADADVLLEQLETLGILEYFDASVISSNVKAYKPSDATIKELLKYCDEPYSGILFIGDTIVDVKTARKMKVKAVLIDRDSNFKINADYRISGLNQIFDIISEINGSA